MRMNLAQWSGGLARSTLTTAFVAAGAVSVAAQSDGEAIVRTWVDSENRVPFIDFEAGAIASNGDTVAVNDLAITLEIDASTFGQHATDDTGSFAYRIVFPSATFRNLTDQGDRFATDMFTAEEVIVEMQIEGDESMESGFRYEGFSIANWSWAKIPEIAEDADRPVSRFLPAAVALYDHDFDSAIMEAATGTTSASDDSEFALNYGKVVVGRTRAGNISRLDGDGLSMNGTDENDVSVGVQVGAFSVVDYNIAELFRAFEPGAIPSEKYETLIGGYRIDGIDVSGSGDGGEFAFSLGEMLLEDIGIRSPSIPVLERVDAMVAASLADEGSEPDEREVVELVGAAYGAFSLGAYEVSDVRAVINGLEVLDLQSIGIHDLSAAGLGEFFIREFVFQSPEEEEDVSGRVGEISIAGLTFPPLEALLALEDASENEDVAAVLAAMPTLERFTASDIALDTPEMLMSLRAYVIEMADHIGPIPTSFSIDIEDVDIPVSEMEPEQREQLEALGYDRLIGSLGLAGVWDEDTGSVDLESEVSFEDGAWFSLAATIGGITRQFFEDPEAAAPLAMFSATLEGATISLEDDSLRDRIIDMVAEQQGTEPEMVRQMALGIVPFALAQLNRPQFAQAVSAAFKTFLEGEGNLNVDIAPSEPVPLMQLSVEAQADPGSAIDKLNITVDAE